MSPDQTVFYIEWGGSADLAVRDIWPDGDAPENPTTQDVLAAMLKSSPSLDRMCEDWSIREIEEVEISGPGGYISVTDRTFREARNA